LSSFQRLALNGAPDPPETFHSTSVRTAIRRHPVLYDRNFFPDPGLKGDVTGM